MGDLKIENKNQHVFNIEFKVYESIKFYEIIQKVICNFNELFNKNKFPVRLVECNERDIDKNYSLKLSKKNGHPKVDIPSKLKNFYKILIF